MGEDPRPVVTEEGRRLGHGAGLAEGAGGPGVPERRVARRQAMVRPAYRYGSVMWSSPGEAAWLIAAAVMPASKCAGHSTGPAGLSPGISAARRLSGCAPRPYHSASRRAAPGSIISGASRSGGAAGPDTPAGAPGVTPANSAAVRTVVRGVRLVPAAPLTTSSVPSTARNLASVPKDGGQKPPGDGTRPVWPVAR